MLEAWSFANLANASAWLASLSVQQSFPCEPGLRHRYRASGQESSVSQKRDQEASDDTRRSLALLRLHVLNQTCAAALYCSCPTAADSTCSRCEQFASFSSDASASGACQDELGRIGCRTLHGTATHLHRLARKLHNCDKHFCCAMPFARPCPAAHMQCRNGGRRYHTSRGQSIFHSPVARCTLMASWLCRILATCFCACPPPRSWCTNVRPDRDRAVNLPNSAHAHYRLVCCRAVKH